VAKEVAVTLSPEELSAALAHELAHVRFCDNLKQLLLKITRPPNWMGGTAVDSAWTGISEVAADEAALAAGASPLDLASALVKIVTLKRHGGGPNKDENEHALAASHLVPNVDCSSLAMRIERLQRVLAGASVESGIKSARNRWRIAGGMALALALYLTVFSMLLPTIHEALEFLVR
jgi:Zn-dependent protease with chaperone function